MIESKEIQEEFNKWLEGYFDKFFYIAQAPDLRGTVLESKQGYRYYLKPEMKPNIAAKEMARSKMEKHWNFLPFESVKGVYEYWMQYVWGVTKREYSCDGQTHVHVCHAKGNRHLGEAEFSEEEAFKIMMNRLIRSQSS